MSRPIEYLEETLVSACKAVAGAVAIHGLDDNDQVAVPLADLSAVMSVALGYEGDETLPEALSLLSEVHEACDTKDDEGFAKLLPRIDDYLRRVGVLEPQEVEQ